MPSTTVTASPLTDASSDALLIDGAAAGHPAAFAALMRRYNRLMFRSARGVVNDDAEAQDVVQEAWLRAFATLPTFRGDAQLGTWLARIAFNVAFDVQRRHRRSVPLHDSPFTDAEATMEHAAAFNAPAAHSPEAEAERKQMQALLQRAIDALPPLYRGVFILRAVQEMSVEDTAACLGVTADVVKTRYLRARALLRDHLGARVEAHASDVYAFAGARCEAVVAHVMSTLGREGRLRPQGPG